jgi:L-fuconolactonase
MTMQIVDTHCHASPLWYEPVEMLLHQMDRNNVAHAVLIQMMGQFDNSYQGECQRRYPGRFASIVIVDTDRPDAAETLGALAASGAAGIRLRPTTRSPGDDPFAIWRAVARLDLTVSCMGSADDFASAAFADLIAQLPGLRIVVEHLGSLKYADAAPDRAETVKQVFALARFPNTFVKVPGLGECCRRTLPVGSSFPFDTPLPPFYELAYEAFGPHRMMWGSDYPPVSCREGYANALRFAMERYAPLPQDEQEAIFGGTAMGVFAIR